MLLNLQLYMSVHEKRALITLSINPFYFTNVQIYVHTLLIGHMLDISFHLFHCLNDIKQMFK